MHREINHDAMLRIILIKGLTLGTFALLLIDEYTVEDGVLLRTDFISTGDRIIDDGILTLFYRYSQ